MAISYKLEIKYGSAPSDPYVDETAYLDEFFVTRGLPIVTDQKSRMAAICEVGKAEFVLDNRTRRFSERYASSPLYGDSTPYFPMRFWVLNQSGSGDMVLLSGLCQEWISPGERYGERKILLKCAERIIAWETTPVSSIEGSKTRQVDDTIDFLAQQAGAIAIVNTDNGDVLSQGLLGIDVQRTSVYDALRLVAENFFGRIFYRGSESDSSYASLVYLTRDAFHSPGGSFAALIDASYLAFQEKRAFHEHVGWVRVAIYPQATVSTTQVLWQSGAVLRIAAGATREISMFYRDPETGQRCEASSVITPVATTDYVVVNAAGYTITSSITLNVTKELRRAVIEIVNPLPVDAYFNLLQIRGNPVTTYEPLTMEANWTGGFVGLDMPMRNQPEDAEQVINYVMQRFQGVHHCDWCEIDGSEAALYANFTDYDLGEYVTITEYQSGLSAVLHMVRRVEYRGKKGKAARIRLYFDGLPPYMIFELDGSDLDGPDILGW